MLENVVSVDKGVAIIAAMQECEKFQCARIGSPNFDRFKEARHVYNGAMSTYPVTMALAMKEFLK